MSEKCCNRVGVQSTHWEGCHEVHPSCAAFKAGREAGMREAVDILQREKVDAESTGEDADEAYNVAITHCTGAILSAIGEGK